MEPRSDRDQFAENLRVAIAKRGLGLEALVDRLRARGIACSASTLSLWRNGRTHPRRSEAIRAVEALEEILCVPRGFLTGAIVRRSRETMTQLDPDNDFGHILEEGQRQLGLTDCDHADRLAMREIVWIGPERRITRTRVKVVLRGTHTPTLKLPFTIEGFAAQDGAWHPRTIVPNHGVQTGDSIAFPDRGLSMHELLLDKPLGPGDVEVIEFDTVVSEQEIAGTEQYCEHFLRSSRPVPSMVLELRFQENDMPARIDSAASRTSAPEHAEYLPVKPYGRFAARAHNDVYGGGIHMTWSWETP